MTLAQDKPARYGIHNSTMPAQRWYQFGIAGFIGMVTALCAAYGYMRNRRDDIVEIAVGSVIFVVVWICCSFLIRWVSQRMTRG
jgi:uncharacterized BrkB/YihY/UPF0761 family membrane protein